jgi:hypothetical protein
LAAAVSRPGEIGGAIKTRRPARWSVAKRALKASSPSSRSYSAAPSSIASRIVSASSRKPTL